MNVKEYKEKKAKGLAEIVRAGGGYAFAVKKFDSDDGSELSPEIESIDIDDLIYKKEELVNELKDYDEMITDIEKL